MKIADMTVVALLFAGTAPAGPGRARRRSRPHRPAPIVHVAEVVAASREGGASLTVLSGLVAGNFSAFWKGLVMVGLMLAAYMVSMQGLDQFMVYPAVFAFGLVAFGFLGMGPVTIAVDSYGPVTDNAQSVFELSQIETLPGIVGEIEKTYALPVPVWYRRPVAHLHAVAA